MSKLHEELARRIRIKNLLDAKMLRYNINTTIFSGRLDVPDQDLCLPAKAIYVPTEGVFVTTRRINLGFMLSEEYSVEIDELAEQSYQRLLQQLQSTTNGRIKTDGRITPEKIQVPGEFVTWARTFYQSRHPSEKVSRLLQL